LYIFHMGGGGRKNCKVQQAPGLGCSSAPFMLYASRSIVLATIEGS
jgi:hypothetical protein